MVARVVVVPSEWYENAPLSVLEAYALGKPVLVSSHGGLPELVVSGQTGLIFEGGEAAELSDCLTRLKELADRDIEAMGVAARERVEQSFSPQAYLGSVRALYGELQR